LLSARAADCAGDECRSLMALFSKPPVKKPEPPKPDAKARGAARGLRPVSAREVAAQAGSRPGVEHRHVEPSIGDITVTGASMIEWAPQHSAIEVAQANPGLCAVLENAALLYASGQPQPARALLEQGVQNDPDAKLSPLAWLALFDLLQRAGDRAAFDQFALLYVVQFERSSPAWEESSPPQSAPRAVAGGYVGLTGKLSAASAPQLDTLRRTMAKRVAHARLDFAGLTGIDDVGARLLADVLAEARRQQFKLQLQHPERLVPTLELLVKKGREAGEGAWLLSLEMLQWQNDRATFEDRAVEFAVTFELSPPSWEPPVVPVTDTPVEDAAGAKLEGDTLRVSGLMTGTASPQLGRIADFAQTRAVIPIDMSEVERIDFVCAGALLNTINRVETQRRAVQIVGASPIIRALLLLIGISPRHFVKKAA
jgi:ABC-type transporter Mla MlaB component